MHVSNTSVHKVALINKDFPVILKVFDNQNMYVAGINAVAVRRKCKAV